MPRENSTFCLLWDIVSFVALAVFELFLKVRLASNSEITSASQVLGLKVYTTTPNYNMLLDGKSEVQLLAYSLTCPKLQAQTTLEKRQFQRGSSGSFLNTQCQGQAIRTELYCWRRLLPSLLQLCCPNARGVDLLSILHRQASISKKSLQRLHRTHSRHYIFPCHDSPPHFHA